MSASEETGQNLHDETMAFEEILHLAAGIDPEDNEYWDAVRILQSRLLEFFPHLRAASRSPDASVRETVATVLGQNLMQNKVIPAECTDVHLEMLSVHQPVSVLSAILFAMGHLNDPRSISLALSFVDHADAGVRYAVTSTLACHEDDEVIKALIRLSRDEDREVRNWATFDLGSMIATDTPGIRKALLDRLDEEDFEIHGEAVVGLAVRRDARVIPVLLKEMNSLQAEVKYSLIMDAARGIMEHSTDLGTEWQPVLDKCGELKIVASDMESEKP